MQALSQICICRKNDGYGLEVFGVLLPACGCTITVVVACFYSSDIGATEATLYGC